MTTSKNPTTKKKKVTRKKSDATKKVSKTKTEKPIRSNQQTLKLDPVLVINNAKALSVEFEKLINSNEDISIDASAVEMVDTAILQLLLTMVIKIKSSKHQVHWLNPSAVFISNSSLLGMSASLGLV